MRMMNPFVMVSRLGYVVSGTCGGWNCFSSTLLGFLEYWGIYRAKRRCGRPPRWAQPTRARLGPQVRPGGLCSPRSPLWNFFGPTCVSGLEKISKNFRCIWTLFGIDFLRSKKTSKKQQLARGTMSIG